MNQNQKTFFLILIFRWSYFFRRIGRIQGSSLHESIALTLVNLNLTLHTTLWLECSLWRGGVKSFVLYGWENWLWTHWGWGTSSNSPTSQLCATAMPFMSTTIDISNWSPIQVLASLLLNFVFYMVILKKWIDRYWLFGRDRYLNQ